ncbi:anthranilate synthase component 1 [Actinomyces gaoshouyii]|uniref:anthranilate synthase component 1 n=1 Tax=Actinomyces gaoshouyii TaxID=1960083 RepID=UPI0009BE06B7|nr:anthranilate synthase component 1 [Actinomyces gaoshouyii]ARD41851.1 anthranilate synthase component I [Actinomyces gaoshouyii]
MTITGTAGSAEPADPIRPAEPTVLTRRVRYPHDSGALVRRLAEAGAIATTADAAGSARRPVDVVLLESADITTGSSRTTVLMLEASARLTCEGNQVVIEALDRARPDGEAAVARMRASLADRVVEEAPGRLAVRIPSPADSAGMEERERLTAPSTLEPLRVLASQEVDHPHLPLVAGVFAFDYLAGFEQLPQVSAGPNTCPDYLFYTARILLVIDHPTGEATLVGASVDADDLARRIDELATVIDTARPAPAPDAGGPAPVAGGAGPVSVPAARPIARAVPSVSDSDFAGLVAGLQESIAAGDVYQVVPSRAFTIDCPDALKAYRALRESNPSPYMFYVAAPGFELLGASPESALLHSAATGEVAIRPIAGTRPRGLAPDGSVDHERDTRLELELRTDAKEIAEHVMLVDLARNDVARVSAPGTRKVRELLRVDRYSRVMHLVSEVSGQLDPGLDALDAFRASMTMGTLTGAPKLRAAELIRATEGMRRGSYGGSVGYLRGDGELDTCIVIRSAFVAGGRALVQAGAGVVGASDPAAEAAETVHKASAVLAAVAAARGAELVIETGEA